MGGIQEREPETKPLSVSSDLLQKLRDLTAMIVYMVASKDTYLRRQGNGHYKIAPCAFQPIKKNEVDHLDQPLRPYSLLPLLITLTSVFLLFESSFLPLPRQVIIQQPLSTKMVTRPENQPQARVQAIRPVYMTNPLNATASSVAATESEVVHVIFYLDPAGREIDI